MSRQSSLSKERILFSSDKSNHPRLVLSSVNEGIDKNSLVSRQDKNSLNVRASAPCGFKIKDLKKKRIAVAKSVKVLQKMGKEAKKTHDNITSSRGSLSMKR